MTLALKRCGELSGASDVRIVKSTIEPAEAGRILNKVVPVSMGLHNFQEDYQLKRREFNRLKDRMEWSFWVDERKAKRHSTEHPILY